MTTPTQMVKLFQLFVETPTEQIQRLFTSGLLTDLRDGNIDQVDREEFRRVLGLKPLRSALLDGFDPIKAFERGNNKERRVRITHVARSFKRRFMSKKSKLNQRELQTLENFYESLASNQAASALVRTERSVPNDVSGRPDLVYGEWRNGGWMIGIGLPNFWD